MTERQQEIAAAVQAAVAAGIKEVLDDEEAVGKFWGAAFAQLQQRAAESTGQWVLGGLRALASKISMFVGLAALVYALGGWAALAKLWAVMGEGK